MSTEATNSLPIEQLNSCDLLGEHKKGIIYPITVTHAVKCLDENGNPIEGVECCLEDRLTAIEAILNNMEAITEEDINTLSE